MKELPILFSGSMVRAILEGRKTQTRRVIKPQPRLGWGYRLTAEFKAVQVSTTGVRDRVFIKCPYGQPGDRLWVRETWRCPDGRSKRILYGADYANPGAGWHSPIRMPRRASRITLEITGIRVERVQEISEEDAEAEGCSKEPIGAEGRALEGMHFTARKQFAGLWDSINAKRGFGWGLNPFVWVLYFRKLL
jgi:hypothetical protein